MVVDAYRLLAHKAVVAAEYAAAVAVRLAGRLLLVAAIKEGMGGSQIELTLRLENMETLAEVADQHMKHGPT